MISEEALQKYRYLGLLARSEDYPPKDGPYQDYTYFRRSSLAAVRRFWKKTVRLILGGGAPKTIILYIHWPFCLSQCTYCFCSMAVSTSRTKMSSYAELLKREIDAFADIFEPVEFESVYIGGGTPSYISNKDMESLFGHIHSSLRIRKEAEIYMESSPATLTASKMKILRRHGVNRMTLGVQSRDAKVLRGVNRVGQTAAVVESAWNAMAQTSGLIRDIDLMLGIANQDRLSFIKDLVWAIRKEADVIHVNSFDPRHQTLFSKAGNSLDSDYWPEVDKSLRIAERLLHQAGYRIQHYNLDAPSRDPVEKILSDDPFELSSMFAIGLHGKAHAYGSGWYQHPPVTLKDCGSKKIPPFTYFPGGGDEEPRAYVIRSLCLHEKVSLRAFESLFGRPLSSLASLMKPLGDLERLGKVSLGGAHLRLEAKSRVERLVWLKHLYSKRMLGDLMRRHRRGFAKFQKDYAADPERILGELKSKAEARSFHRVYYRRGAKAKTPAKEERERALS